MTLSTMSIGTQARGNRCPRDVGLCRGVRNRRRRSSGDRGRRMGHCSKIRIHAPYVQIQREASFVKDTVLAIHDCFNQGLALVVRVIPRNIMDDCVCSLLCCAYRRLNPNVKPLKDKNSLVEFIERHQLPVRVRMVTW